MEKFPQPEQAVLCATCLARRYSLCHATIETVLEGSSYTMAPLLASSALTVPAQQIIYSETDLHDFVTIIGRGWAMREVILADGRRQIMQFLLPGDIIFSALKPESTSKSALRTITEVVCRTFNRNEFMTVLFKHSDLFDELLEVWAEEKRQADQRAVDLGRHTAKQRIARLLIYLYERLASRGLTSGQVIDFPLRQRHIADATGSHFVLVSRVLSEFHSAGLIEISRNRTLMIRDFMRLRSAGNMDLAAQS